MRCSALGDLGISRCGRQKNNNFLLSAPAFLPQRIGPVGSRDTTQRERALSVMPGLLLPVVGTSTPCMQVPNVRSQLMCWISGRNTWVAASRGTTRLCVLWCCSFYLSMPPRHRFLSRCPFGIASGGRVEMLMFWDLVGVVFPVSQLSCVGGACLSLLI